MDPSNQPSNPSKLSIDELRKFPGLEYLTDAELEAHSNSLLELSLILYEIYSVSSDGRYKEGIDYTEFDKQMAPSKKDLQHH